MTKIKYTAYLHGSKENNYEQLEELKKEFPSLENMSEEAQINFRYSLYEVIFEMELDTETGVTKIKKVDGKELIE